MPEEALLNPINHVRTLNKSEKFAIFQFNILSVAPGSESPVMYTPMTTYGNIVMLRTICDSDAITVVLSSSPNKDDIRRVILTQESDAKDFSIDYYNDRFMKTFWLQEDEPKMYYWVKNNGGADTGVIVGTLILGE